MIQRSMLVSLVCGLLLSSSGCGVFHALVYEPFGPNTLCDTTRCQAAAWREPDEAPVEEAWWGPPCRWHRPLGCRCRAGVCQDPCELGGDPWWGPCVGWCRGPLAWVFSLFHCGTFCGNGCGERYWGDWYGDPPDCCDPCDNYGNFTGGGAGCGDWDGLGEPDPAPQAARNGVCPYCGSTHPGAASRSGRPAGPYAATGQAPRIISQTDRAIAPAQGQAAPQVAGSRRAPSRR
ncbi:MAG: hypothetical protein ACUVUC_06200 [Thermoguttaceae bacterium]